MHKGYRFLDDYEFGCSSYSEAEGFLANLQEALAVYELQLNPHKTHIEGLPSTVQGEWAPQLRSLPIREKSAAQRTDLITFFDLAFKFHQMNLSDSVLKYAVRRIKNRVTISSKNWGLYESLLLQAAAVEPGVLPDVVIELANYSRCGYDLDKESVEVTLSDIISTHAKAGHGSELAWAVWGAIELECKIGAIAGRSLSYATDPFVNLLSLDAESRGLLNIDFRISNLVNPPKKSDLRDTSWVLAYEALLRGWLVPDIDDDPVAQDDYFSWLRQGNVSFYRPDATCYNPNRQSTKRDSMETESIEESDDEFYP